jgi:hypothetical protein
MQRLPRVQNVYSDLLDRLLDDALAEIGGTPVQRTIRGAQLLVRAHLPRQRPGRLLWVSR